MRNYWFFRFVLHSTFLCLLSAFCVRDSSEFTFSLPLGYSFSPGLHPCIFKWKSSVWVPYEERWFFSTISRPAIMRFLKKAFHGSKIGLKCRRKKVFPLGENNCSANLPAQIKAFRERTINSRAERNFKKQFINGNYVGRFRKQFFCSIKAFCLAQAMEKFTEACADGIVCVIETKVIAVCAIIYDWH